MDELEIHLKRGVITIKGNKVDYDGGDDEDYYYTDSGTLSSKQLDSITAYLSALQHLNNLKAPALSKLTDGEIKALKALGEI